MSRTRKSKFKKIIKSRKKRLFRKVKHSRKNMRKKKGGFGDKQRLVEKLNQMLLGQHHLTRAEDFIDEVILEMCPPNMGSPISPTEIKTPSSGPDGTELDNEGKKQAKEIAAQMRQEASRKRPRKIF